MWLQRLSETPGLPGAEDGVRALLMEAVRPAAQRLAVDAMGNLVAGRGLDLPGPRLLLTAHMDEVGLMVTRIEDSGLLAVAPLGGLDPRILPGKAVRVGTAGLPGCILHKPIHLKKDEERRKVTPAEELRVDIGARDREQASQAVQVGDPVWFDTPFSVEGRRAMGKAFDDRAGCVVLLESFLRARPGGPVLAGFTVQEEVGLRGARVLAHAVRPDAAIALECTVCADLPDVPAHLHATRLGAGPVLTFADGGTLPHARLVERIIAVAERRGIPWQWRQTVGGATEAGALALARDGVAVATISVPCRYIHAPTSLLDLDDLEAAIRLVTAVIEELGEGGFSRA